MNTYRPYVIYPTMLLATVASIEMIAPQVAWSQSQEIAANAKAVTVLIEGPKIGSGVIIDKQGITYFILTNRHVMDAWEQYFIQTVDGQSYRVRKVIELNGADLALATFQSNRRYPIASIGDSDTLSEGQNVHISGYPRPRIVNRERTYNFYSDTLNGRLSSPVDGYELILNEGAIKAMSGSPILDNYGQLIGIFGLAESGGRGQQISSYGIPINTAIRLINRQIIQIDGQTIQIDWRTSEQIGQTPEQMGREQYLSMVLNVKTRISNLSNRYRDAKLKFPIGVSHPIRLGISTSPANTSNLEVIGYFDNATNNIKPFTANDLLELIDDVAEILANNNSINVPLLLANLTPFGKQIQPSPPLIAQRQTALVIDLVVYNPNNREIYLIPNVKVTALCRDVLNAVLNNQLETHNYDLNRMGFNNNGNSSQPNNNPNNNSRDAQEILAQYPQDLPLMIPLRSNQVIPSQDSSGDSRLSEDFYAIGFVNLSGKIEPITPRDLMGMFQAGERNGGRLGISGVSNQTLMADVSSSWLQVERIPVFDLIVYSESTGKIFLVPSVQASIFYQHALNAVLNNQLKRSYIDLRTINLN